jgi:glycosyltransferase involved in cell wall biosynthesis
MILFFRRSVGHFFSIEKVFFTVVKELESQIPVKKVFLPHHTSSVTNIIKNLLFARKQKDNLYHVTGDVHYLVLSLPSKKAILTIHDCVFLHRHSGIKRWFLQKIFLDWPVKHSKIITTISEQSKREIIEYTNCSPEKIRVINNPVSEYIYYKAKTFNAENPVLLFLGSTPNKNLPRAIEAIKGLNCVLHIVGILPDTDNRLLGQYGIVYKTSINLSEQQLADAFYEADVLYFPTLYEGFGLPIVEAQKAGRAVLTSNISPMKEVAGAGACLVDPTNIDSIRKGLISILEDAEYRGQLVSKGLQNVQRFAPAKVAAEYLKVYKEVEANSQ